MAGRMFVDDIGISLVYSHGTMRYPWPEIASVDVWAWLLPPLGQRLVEIDISHVSGESTCANEMLDGFFEAAAAIATRSGARLPDLTVLDPSDGVIQIYP